MRNFWRATGRVLSCCFLAAVSTNGALAQQPAANTNYYAALLSQGYEVKNVLLISASDSTRLTGAVQQQDTVLVTLQKGGATATCWVVFTAWNQQSLSGTSTPCNLLH